MAINKEFLRGFAVMTVAFSEFVGIMTLAAALGWWLYAKQGLPEWIFILVGVVAMTLAFYRLYRFAKKDFMPNEKK